MFAKKAVTSKASHGGMRTSKDLVFPQTGSEETLKISLDSYMTLVHSLTNLGPAGPSHKYVIPHVNVAGVAEEHCAQLTVRVEIEVLEAGTVTIPLLSTDLALRETRTEYRATSGEGDTASHFAISGDKHSVVLSDEGKYVIECVVEAPYANDRRRQLILEIPESSFGTLEFRVKGDKNWQITASPTLLAESAPAEDKSATVLHAKFAPTTTLNIQWTEVVAAVLEKPEKALEQKKGEEMITCEQETTYSVGEGVLTVNSNFALTLVHASRGVFMVSVPSALRILQVSGDAIKRWRVVDSVEDSSALSEDGEGPKRSRVAGGGGSTTKIIRVELNYAVTDRYRLSIGSEMDMGGTSVQDFVVPILHVMGINRERAFFVIEARTTVEVDEVETRAVAPLDLSETPVHMRTASANSLYAYKSLGPKDALVKINVTKHQDTDVLVTAIEHALYETTVSAEGKALHRIRMHVRNTHRQYLRATFPAGFKIWSTVVGSKPMKPATDSEGRVMIPLQKSHGSGQQSSFLVEIVYLVELEEMRSSGKGTVDLSFAQLDIPVNLLMVRTWLPKRYTYGKTRGNIEQTARFSKDITFTPLAMRYGGEGGMPQVQMRSNLESNVFLSKKMVANSKMKKKAMVKGSAIPVKVDLPTVGTQLLFEKLLVTHEEQHVVIPYKAKPNQGKKRKGVLRWLCCCFGN